MEFKKGYYYLTVNYQLKRLDLEKVSSLAFFVNDPFIRQHWKVETEDDYIRMLMATENIVYSSIISGRQMTMSVHG